MQITFQACFIINSHEHYLLQWIFRADGLRYGVLPSTDIFTTRNSYGLKSWGAGTSNDNIF